MFIDFPSYNPPFIRKCPIFSYDFPISTAIYTGFPQLEPREFFPQAPAPRGTLRPQVGIPGKKHMQQKTRCMFCIYTYYNIYVCILAIIYVYIHLFIYIHIMCVLAIVALNMGQLCKPTRLSRNPRKPQGWDLLQSSNSLEKMDQKSCSKVSWSASFLKIW